MKLRIKKYLFLINDVTNLLLKKDREENGEKIKSYQRLFTFTLILLLISFFLNIYLLYKFL